MGFYDDHILPHLIHLACGNKAIDQQRKKVVPKASGRVLEIGMGSGLNLPHYDRSAVELVWGLEPSNGMRKKARKRIEASDLEVRWIDLPGEEIPLDDQSADTIVLTYTLCTIPNWQRALDQMRRVLKPSGRLLFSEHGEAPDKNVRAWQRRLDPFWGKIAGGCHLSRPIPKLITQGGFELKESDSMYIPGPKFGSYNYWGTAQIL